MTFFIIWLLCGLIGAALAWHRSRPDELTLGSLVCLCVTAIGGLLALIALGLLCFVHWVLFAPPIVLWHRKP